MNYFLLAVALWLWWMTLSLTIKQILFLRSSVLTNGTLIRWKQSSSRYKTYWYPVVSYRVASGEIYEATGNTGIRSNDAPATDKNFKVRYKMNYPEKAQISSLFHFWAAPFGFLIFALAITIAFLDKVGIINIPNAA